MRRAIPEWFGTEPNHLVLAGSVTLHREVVDPGAGLAPSQGAGRRKMFQTVESVLISVITYKRPHDLDRMIESLLKLRTSVRHRILVVDNDSQGSAGKVASKYKENVKYVLEPRPGIAAARNRCIQEMQPSDDALAFLDDDETVTPTWLDEIVECANAYRVGIVAGPVISILPDDAPKWVNDTKIFQRRVRSTGATDGLPATNNSLVRATVLRRNSDVRFDDSFSVTGGSDSDFFARLVRRGERFVWTKSAIVQEYVQTERLNVRWLVRRYMRGGETTARVLLSHKPRSLIIANGGLYVVAGFFCLPISLIARPTFRGRTFILLARGMGLIRGSLGRAVKEYERT